MSLLRVVPQKIRFLSTWALHLAQPYRDGTIGAQSRDSAGHSDESSCGGLLQPTSFRWPHRHRSKPDLVAGPGYQDTPGIYSREQVSAWRIISEEVHGRGGHMTCRSAHGTTPRFMEGAPTVIPVTRP